MGAQWYDALVTIPGCDKNMPGSVMAMARLNRPSLMVYGGTIRAGPRAGPGARHHLGVPVLRRVPRRRHHRRAAASTSCSTPARAPAPAAACTRPTRWPWPSRRWAVAAVQLVAAGREPTARPTSAGAPGAAVRLLLERDLKPLDILTPQGVRERDDAGDGGRRLDQRRAAPAGDRAHGRRAARRSTTSSATSDRVPLLADLKPSGRYVQEDLHDIGGTPALMKYLLDARASCTATR